MSSDLTKKLESFISGYKGSEAITLAFVARENNCSVDQVRRRVGDLVKAKKEGRKNMIKESTKKKVDDTATTIDSSILIKIMNRLDKIESKLDSILSDEWIENTGDAPPDGRLCKVVYCNGKVVTGVSDELFWDNYDYECGAEKERVETELLDLCRGKAADFAEKDTEEKFPEFKGSHFDSPLFDRSANDWFSQPVKLTDEEEAEEGRHNKARAHYRDVLDRKAWELFDFNRSKYLENNYFEPDKARFIKKYKIIDDSNSRVMDKLAVISRKLNS